MRVDILSGSNCCSEPVSYAAVEEDGTSGLVIEVFDDLDKVCADVVLLHGCQQSCMPNPVEGKASTAYGMEISAEKTKLMTDNTSGINTEIKVNGQRLKTVTSFKYLGSVITDEGSKPQILSRTAQTSSTDKAETSLD